MNYTGNPCADFVLDRLFVVAVVVMALVCLSDRAAWQEAEPLCVDHANWSVL